MRLLSINLLGMELFPAAMTAYFGWAMMAVVRCPLSTFLTFINKKSTDMKESRKKRQEKEREYARKQKYH